MSLVFVRHFGGRVLRDGRTRYEGGETVVHPDKFDIDCLSYFEIFGILKDYGWISGDHVYYQDPAAREEGGFILIKGNEHVLQMVNAHVHCELASLFLVSYAEEENMDADEIEDLLEEGERHRSRLEPLDDLWWEGRISDSEDAYDDQVESAQYIDEVEGEEAGPSTAFHKAEQVSPTVGTSSRMEHHGTTIPEDVDFFEEDFGSNDDGSGRSEDGKEDILISPVAFDGDEDDSEVTAEAASGIERNRKRRAWETLCGATLIDRHRRGGRINILVEKRS